MNSLRFFRILISLFLLFGMFIPFQWLALRFSNGKTNSLAQKIPVFIFRAFLWVCDFRVSRYGPPPSAQSPVLIVANHVSWLDIPVINSLMPLSFISKADVSKWPGIGFMARLARTIFLDRSRKTETAKVNLLIAERLQNNDKIVLFPEGTTGDGIHLLPFRSALLGALHLAVTSSQKKSIMLQPLSIRYVKRNGCPVTRSEMPEIAWYGNVDFAFHARQLFKKGPLDIEVIWGEPILFDERSDRKKVTSCIQQKIKVALQEKEYA